MVGWLVAWLVGLLVLDAFQQAISVCSEHISSNEILKNNTSHNVTYIKPRFNRYQTNYKPSRTNSSPMFIRRLKRHDFRRRKQWPIKSKAVEMLGDQMISYRYCQLMTLIGIVIYRRRKDRFRNPII